MNKTTYTVTYAATYEVTGHDLDDAIEAAIDEHENMPQGSWDAVPTPAAYTYDSTGHMCQVCTTAPIDEYGCQANMKDGEPVCVDCCTCPEHVADRALTWTAHTVCHCDGCGALMLPNVSTMDEDGCGWICLTPACADYTANELEPEDLQAVGVPEWVARLVCSLTDELTAYQLKICPAHQGGYDCTPFCPICEGNQEFKVRA